MAEHEMDDWKPPNEAELKVIEARRERNNQISRLMGEYMLKGYRMLDKLCGECNTILLQDRNEQYYCVACNELQSETSKDDPAISAEAAAASVLEQHQRRNADIQDETYDNSRINYTPVVASEREQTAPLPETTPAATSTLPQTIDLPIDNVQLISSYMKVKAKIETLSNQLTQCDKPDEIKSICDAIKACSDSAIAIKKLI